VSRTYPKKLLSALGMEYEKIDACKDYCMLFYEDGGKVMMKVAHKQPHYMPLTPQMKWLFPSKKTARHTSGIKKVFVRTTK
jgi:hypothetical protein